MIDLAGDQTWTRMLQVLTLGCFAMICGLQEWRRDAYLEERVGDELIWLEERNTQQRNNNSSFGTTGFRQQLRCAVIPTTKVWAHTAQLCMNECTQRGAG